MTTRRTFLQTTAALAASCVLPRSIFAPPAPTSHFLHADTLNSWPIPDPVAWSLLNAHQPLLAHAAEGLAKLTTNDGDRIITLVVRRCRLNLIELQRERVVVHHWGQHRADLRPFFKLHGLARPEVEVVLRDRKKEVSSTTTGDSFLHGDRLSPDFPLDLFQRKWIRHFEREADDWHAAPRTNSGFAWEGLENGAIPWSTLKCAWRRSDPGSCLNCEGETLLVNFGLRQIGMFNRAANFVRVCGACRRSFRDESVRDVNDWMVANLDAEVRPDAEMVWGKRVLASCS